MDVQVCLEPLDSVLPAESDTELTGHADGTERRDAAQPDEQASQVPCMWKRLAGRPTAGAVPSPSPPTSRRCKVPSFCIGRALAPWIIRTRQGPQPEEIAACALHVEAAVGSTHGWCKSKSTGTYQQAL